jgi:predicted DsbA family dithiol-disulfide isomerase
MTVAVKMTLDFICPWCLIGEVRLRNAIKLLPEDIEVEVEWLPYELNPLMPPQGIARNVYRTGKFGTLEKGRALDAQTIAASKDDGVVFNYDKMFKTPNSFNAHCLSSLAAREGKQCAIVDGLLKGYFVEGRDIGDTQELVEIAVAAGLERERARHFLEKKVGERDVRAQLASARTAGVQAVPYFDIEGVIIVGAQGSNELRDALVAAHERK